jgi:hypothetical protein
MGAYVGGLLITFLVTRLVQNMLRRRVGPTLAAIWAFCVVAILSLVVNSLTTGPAEGLSRFALVYLPCLLVWLGVDLYRLRASPPSEPR